MLDYRIGIASDYATLEPGHDFIDNWKVVVYGKEGEIGHLWIDACIDILLTYRRTRYDAVCLTLEDGC